jgi:hypothetical protein
MQPPVPTTLHGRQASQAAVSDFRLFAGWPAQSANWLVSHGACRGSPAAFVDKDPSTRTLGLQGLLLGRSPQQTGDLCLDGCFNFSRTLAIKLPSLGPAGTYQGTKVLLQKQVISQPAMISQSRCPIRCLTGFLYLYHKAARLLWCMTPPTCLRRATPRKPPKLRLHSRSTVAVPVTDSPLALRAATISLEGPPCPTRHDIRCTTELPDLGRIDPLKLLDQT